MIKVGKIEKIEEEFAQAVRLALGGSSGDLRLYVARLIRRYRKTNPKFAEALEESLKIGSKTVSRVLRDGTGIADAESTSRHMPLDRDSRMDLLKSWSPGPGYPKPILETGPNEMLEMLLAEIAQSATLAKRGLQPTRSVVFVGPPGVGKTETAKWIASQLGRPLYVLDLTVVMSSYLGKSGSNLRAALDFAKAESCVLLLDEIDAIAKSRSDQTDVGELKRLVTVFLQEVENWDSDSLLVAATNHPEVVDAALWRRFDLVVNFELPSAESVAGAIMRYLGPDRSKLRKWISTLNIIFRGQSISEIERTINRFRRAAVLNPDTVPTLIEEYATESAAAMEHPERKELASALDKETDFSQHTIARITGISRPTIRKNRSAATTAKQATVT